MSEEQKKPGFWSTIPGIFTALAALLGALSGLIGVLNQAGFFKPSAPAPLPVNRTVSEIKLGNYSVLGRNPNGTTYFGEATLNKTDSGYQLTWKIAGRQVFYGSGVIDDQLLKIKWENGLVTYLIKDHGRLLEGSWANGTGSEVLTLISPDP